MSNQRSVMTEFRFLDQKRQAEGLTAEEASRYAQLRDLVGPETAGPPRSGFDVNAAAARLRESLVPAGLRNRPAEPEPPPPPPPPALPEETLALQQAWADAPFTPLTSEAESPLFDPGSLASEVRPQAWNPEAPGYDPDAPYDEAAWIAAGYDPNVTYDWSAAGYATEAQPAEAAPEEIPPVEGEATDWAEPALEALAEDAPLETPAAWAETPIEPAEAGQPGWSAAAGLSAAGQPYEASTVGGGGDLFEPPPAGDAGWDVPEATATEADWGAEAQVAPLDAGPVEAAATASEAPVLPDEALPFDPNAPFDHAKWFGRAGAAGPAAAEPPPAPAGEEDLSFDMAEEPVPAAPAFGEYDEAATTGAPDLLVPLEAEPAVEPQPSDAEPLLPEPGVPAPGLDAGWFDGTPPTGHEPAPAGAPFGEYDEAGAPAPGAPAEGDALEAMLPFDLAAASAIEPGATPEGFEAGGPSLDPATLPALGDGYDDPSDLQPDQMYGGPEGDALPGGTPLELSAAAPDWQPDAALELGFELASDGSFGHAEPAPTRATPAWGTAAASAPGEGWESAPALDLSGPFEAPSLTPSEPLEPWTPPLAPEPTAATEELPTIDGAELLEELPPEAADPLFPAAPDDLSAASPLDGAFETEAAVEAAAYPPPDLAPDLVPPVEPFPESLADPFPEPLEAEALPAEAAPEPASADLEPVFAEAEPIFAEAEPALAEAEPIFAEPTPVEPEAAPTPAWAQPLPEAAVEPLLPAAWEPEPAVSYEPTDVALPPEIAAAYGDGPPAGDTFELPPAVTDELFGAPPEPPLEAEPLEPEPLPAPSVRIDGSHRVVLHTVDGQVKRGLLVDALLDAADLPLEPQGPGATDVIAADQIKAIFFMLAPGEKAPVPEGKKVRVTFRDGRQVAGFSPDYQDGTIGFFMIPADTRTNTGRIWVYQAAVKQVAVS